jgi:hypothetical protein
LITSILQQRTSIGKYDDDQSKTNLLELLISTNYFSIRDGKIITPRVVKTQRSRY